LELLIRTNRLPEAAFLARTYLPSQVSRVVKLWRENLATVNTKVSSVISIIVSLKNVNTAKTFLKLRSRKQLSSIEVDANIIYTNRILKI